ncbi:MAG: hypothetical protein K2Q14_01365, partial [Gammaproteobacteria bacterium]|nr:hypothetical protein [Gammaproteobacteria bacterium]
TCREFFAPFGGLGVPKGLAKKRDTIILTALAAHRRQLAGSMNSIEIHAFGSFFRLPDTSRFFRIHENRPFYSPSLSCLENQLVKIELVRRNL